MAATKLKIVGLTGKAGSGKDHMGRLLWDHLKFLPVSFADALKGQLMVEEGFEFEHMYGQDRPSHARAQSNGRLQNAP